MTLEVRGISVDRGRRRILSDVTAGFSQGRLAVVIGPNGAGKSTLLATAAGLMPPATGSIHWNDVPLPSRRALARLRAYLPQSPAADWPVSVERLVALGLTPHLPAFGRLPPHLAGAVDAALVAHDLVPLREQPATALSGGELARAMLARATVADAALLIVDEPTAGLDPRHALDAARRLRARADAGRTVIVALHDLDLARHIADDVVALKDGRLLAAGAARDVLTAPILSRLYDVAVAVSDEAIRYLG